MLQVIESGDTAWAVGASEGRLAVFQRDEEGWIQLETQEGDELDGQTSELLDALYEGWGGNGNGHASSIPEPSSSMSEDDDPDDDDEEAGEDEDDEPAEKPRSRQRSSSKSGSGRKARR